MLDMDTLVSHLISQGENETKNIEEMKNLLDILVTHCDTEDELNFHLQNGNVTEKKLLFLLESIESMLEQGDDFSRLVNSIFMELYKSDNISSKKKRLL